MTIKKWHLKEGIRTVFTLAFLLKSYDNIIQTQLNQTEIMQRLTKMH